MTESKASHQFAFHGHCQGLRALAPVSQLPWLKLEVSLSIRCVTSQYHCDTDVFNWSHWVVLGDYDMPNTVGVLWWWCWLQRLQPGLCFHSFVLVPWKVSLSYSDEPYLWSCFSFIRLFKEYWTSCFNVSVLSGCTELRVLVLGQTLNRWVVCSGWALNC